MTGFPQVGLEGRRGTGTRSSGRLRRWIAAVLGGLLVALASQPGSAAEAKGEAVRFDLSVLPAAKRYLELAEYPSYLAVVLQNNGVNPSQSGRIIIESGRVLRFRNARVAFDRAEKGVFHYTATVELSIGIAESTFKLPVEADASAIDQGRVSIRIYPPLAGIFPQELTERIQLKLQSVASAAVQQRILDYLDGASQGRDRDRLDLPALFERVLIDSYNLPSVAPGLSGAREPGDAEPLSDQMWLIATLLIWIVAPLTWIGWRRWRRRRRKRIAA